ncbi:unnamed protein product, partial [Urochloa humidicola]
PEARVRGFHGGAGGSEAVVPAAAVARQGGGGGGGAVRPLLLRRGRRGALLRRRAPGAILRSPHRPLPRPLDRRRGGLRRGAPRLRRRAVPLFLLQTLGRALIDAEEKEGRSKVKEVSVMQHHPENKVGWRQLVKYVKLSKIAVYSTASFFSFIRIWIEQANENGCGIPEFIILLVNVVCLVVYIISLFVLLKRLISEVCDGWSS